VKLTTKAIVLLVLLRIVIGWHFLYEGFWKLDQDRLPEQYTSTRYAIYTANEGLRSFFVSSVKDAASIDRLTLPAALARIDQWNDEVAKVTGSSLADDQRLRLGQVRDKLKEAAIQTMSNPDFRTRLAACKQAIAAGRQDTDSAATLQARLANAVAVDQFSIRDQVLKLPDDKTIHFSAQSYLQNSQGPFRWFFRSLIPDLEGLERLTPKSAQERIDGRYNEVLDHFRSAGVPFNDEQKSKLAAIRDKQKQWIETLFNGPEFMARVNDYKQMLERVKSDSGRLNASFTQERLFSDRSRLDTMGAQLLGYVNEPLVELGLQGQKLATASQMAAGSPPMPGSPSAFVDWSVKWGLTFMGVCMMLGLFTPLALLGAAVQLAMFYLATPPWPGLPVAPGEGHFLYVDRNLIELIGVLLLLAANTGKYGLDSLLERYVIPPLKQRWQARAAGVAASTAAAAKQTSA
jgi:uncharacterized membrane protein YphA (DoxX/SURF4 family)